MNLKKALQEKNKLKGAISETVYRLRKYNVVAVGEDRPYNPKSLLQELLGSIDEMVLLKTKIHQANAQVFHQIFRLSELKSLAGQLRHLDCEKSKDKNSNISEPVISIIERDELVKKLDLEIESIQEELDNHNYRTTI